LLNGKKEERRRLKDGGRRKIAEGRMRTASGRIKEEEEGLN
jgi:hypothetical protein